MTPATPEQKEREILEALDRLSRRDRVYANSDPIIHSELLRNATSFGRADYLQADFLAMLDILENDQMILLDRTTDGSVVRLATLGKRRLMMSEEEYQRKSGNVSGSIVYNFQGPVQRFAMTTGSNSPVDQRQTITDLESIMPLIERLVSEVKSHPELPKDTEVEAEQLRLEVKRSRPNIQRIKEYLESLKTLATTVAPIAQLAS
jgi:hypothetical protein